ncbi:hypothetical protein QAD02_011461 [Eretmocerus hayati]|uniref:Uncharacterized protein n=1 Tax=Eretmocerus hayati TaxID=131215 RepID=A0ACC2P1L6_9HYME|nr:hypothetical protein QAD02_011461 [Eretmocerus hayati]
MQRPRISFLVSSLFVILGSDISIEATVDLPPGSNICRRNSEEYSVCLTNTIQDSWPSIVQGIPKLELPSLDPLEINAVKHNLQSDGFVGQVVLRDVKIYGLAKTKFLAVQPTLYDDQIDLDVEVEIPKVFIECDYKADGTVGLVPVGGKGQFNITMLGLRARWSLTGPIQNDKWTVEHFRIDPEVKSMKVYFSDLLNGNEELNNAAIAVVNEYWPLFFDAMKPIVNALADPRLTHFVNHYVFSKVPISQIFP